MLHGKQHHHHHHHPHHPLTSCRMYHRFCLVVLLLLYVVVPTARCSSGSEDNVYPTNEPINKQQKYKSREKSIQESNLRQTIPSNDNNNNNHNNNNNNNNNNHHGRKQSKLKKHLSDDNDPTELTLPPQPTVSLVSSTSVLVSWSLPPRSGLPILFMRIQYRELNTRRKNPQILWSTLDEDISPSTTSYVVKKLKTGATYHFRLAAVYSNHDNRHGPNSDRFLVETPDKSKPPAFGPTIVELKPISPSALSISWQMIEPHMSVSGFVIQYQVYSDLKSQRGDQRRHTSTQGGSKEGDAFQEVNISNPKKKSTSIKGLLPNTPYTVRMFSFNKEGKSAMSNSAVASTLPGRKSKGGGGSIFPDDEDDYAVDSHASPPQLEQQQQRHHHGNEIYREEKHNNDDDDVNQHDTKPQEHHYQNYHHGSKDSFPTRNHSDVRPDHRQHQQQMRDWELLETTDELREAVDALRKDRMLLIVACSILSCFLVLLLLFFLMFICLRNKFVFVVPFSQKVCNNTG